MRFTEEEVSFRFRFQLKAENNPLQSGRLVGFTSFFLGLLFLVKSVPAAIQLVSIVHGKK